MKILIDAVYINNSGGLVLLKYLIQEIQKLNLDIFFILDERIKKYCLVDDNCVKYIKPSELARKSFYSLNSHYFDRVLCFANVPPPISISAKVYTYFHNVTLLSLHKYVPVFKRITWLLKRAYIYVKSKNTDFWIVQTSNTYNLLVSKLGVKSSLIYIIPFYNIDFFSPPVSSSGYKSDYSYIANYLLEKNHELLIKAWIKLAELKFYPTLHITIDNFPAKLRNLLLSAQRVGCNIINHGYCSPDEVKRIYMQSKTVVYTSLNESFGLGLVEAMSMGCDVIGPNLPYITSICKPSRTFVYNADSLAQAIISYELNKADKTECLVRDEILSMINLLVH